MLIAAETPRFVWYLMRGSGMVALLLFTLTLVLGVVGVTRVHTKRWPRLVTSELHRNVALTACCFLLIHIATALLDAWVGLGWIGAIVPFHATYRPLWLGFGVTAFDLVLAVAISSLLRRRISTRSWRLIHWATWALWPVAVIHALGAGSDSDRGWGLVLCVVCIGSGLGALAWRLRWSSLRRRPVSPPPAAHEVPHLGTGEALVGAHRGPPVSAVR